MLMRKTFKILFPILAFVPLLGAQDTLPSILLNTAQVSDVRRGYFGGLSKQADSTLIAIFQLRQLSDVLPWSHLGYVKSYGAGNIATSGVRGLNAGQTALIWNGLNLNNPSLGLSDLSLVSMAAFDGFSVEQGGSSALSGSGAIGGAIHLQSADKFKGTALSLHLSQRSFNGWDVAVKTAYGNERVFGATKVFGHWADNNLSFLNTTRPFTPREELSHARSFGGGFTQDLSWRAGKRHFFSVHGWMQYMDRQIPPTMTMSSSAATQRDITSRWMAHWKFVPSAKWVIQSRLGRLDDHNLYCDTVSHVEGRNITASWVYDGDLVYINNGWRLSFGLNQSYLSGRSLSFAEDKVMWVTRAMLGAGYERGRWSAAVLLAATARDGRFEVFTPQATLGAMVGKGRLRAKIASAFRLPTFNDLYWQGSDAMGNPNLVPENGYTTELGYGYQNEKLKIGLSAFFHLITDMIQWRQEGNVWIPKNIQKVQGLGGEFDASYQFRWLGASWKSSAAYQLTVSQQLSEDRDYHLKQLTYTPVHQGSLGIQFSKERFNSGIRSLFVGQRFITTDNSELLKPYFLLDIDFSCKLFKDKLLLGVTIANLTNMSYQTIAFRPQPGINYSFFINYKFY